MDRLRAVLAALGDNKEKLVIDLSCRRKDDRWFVATNKWQTITDFELNQGVSRFCVSYEQESANPYSQRASASSNPTVPNS